MQRKRFHIVFLLLCMVLLFSISAHAAEMRSSSYIRTKTVSLDLSSNGNLSIYLYVRANSTMDTLGASCVVIERYNGSRWVAEYTFTPRNAPEIQTNNAYRYNTTLTYTPDYTGTDYRAVVTFYAEDADGSDSKDATTNTVTT